ncbi:TRAP transporter small permease [Amorphus sp. 3PC139-8]|uniref:TRAP transporter small permease n=1 Tax=Amorphus sp. 3PC139-8 TaxID=2735676 RepID=UPI00345D1B88
MTRVVRIVEIVASLSLATVTLITFVSVVMRYAFNSALLDAFDMTRMAQGLALAWGIALATQRDEHITIDGLWNMANDRWKRIITAASRVISAGALLVLSWVMILRALRSLHSGISTAELRIVLWPFNFAIAAGIAAAALVALIAVAHSLKSDVR